VNLDPRAIELVLERRLTERRQRSADIGRGVREHRLDRLKRLQHEASERPIAAAERDARHRREAAGEHGSAANLGSCDAGCARHRFNQDAFERALPKLAEEETDEEVMLPGCRPPQQIAQSLCAGGVRPGA
jgi:hypothetical protein